MKNILSGFVVMVFCATAGFAAFSKNDAGTSGAQFLKLGAGARATSMGNAFVGISDDSTAIYWNPAGLSQLQKNNVSLMHAIWFEDISYDWVSYARPVENIGTFGIAIQYLSYGSIKQTDNAGLEMGDFSPADAAATLSYGRKVLGLLTGVSVKYISSKITNTATAYAADIGVMCKMINDKLSIGFAAQNMGTKLKYISEEDPLPASVTLGGAYRIKNHWLIALDANASVDYEANIGFGTEYTRICWAKTSVAVRAGYSTRTKYVGGLNGFTGGVGFTYSNYSLDYAFVPYGDLGDTQRISLSLKF